MQNLNSIISQLMQLFRMPAFGSVWRIPAITIIFVLPLYAFSSEDNVDINTIENIVGIKGAFNQKENVFKISKPRNDVPVMVDGVLASPFSGLTSWASFSFYPDMTMLMGDTVLFQDEVNPVMSVALENGLEVTALHNHFFYDEPRVFFMHIGGHGSSADLARSVKAVWDKIAEIRKARPKVASDFTDNALPQTNNLDARMIETVLGVQTEKNNGMLKAVIGRKTDMDGHTVGSTMGVNTWAVFSGSNQKSIVDGDFCVYENELQDVLKTLRKGNINIVAIHQHMTMENPRLMFIHYWGRGDSSQLAKTLRDALDKTH